MGVDAVEGLKRVLDARAPQLRASNNYIATGFTTVASHNKGCVSRLPGFSKPRFFSVGKEYRAGGNSETVYIRRVTVTGG